MKCVRGCMIRYAKEDASGPIEYQPRNNADRQQRRDLPGQWEVDAREDHGREYDRARPT